MMNKLFGHRSIQVVLAVCVYLALAAHLPLSVHQGLYAISLSIKDVLLWFLPITVFFFIAHAVISFERKALFFVFFLFLFEMCSNAMSVWYAFGCGHVATSTLHAIVLHPVTDAFDPLWRLPYLKPSWWSAEKGSFLGIAIGLLGAWHLLIPKQFLVRGKEMAEWVLTRCIARLIPLFILGFVAKMYKTQLLEQLFSKYTDFIAWLLPCLTLYLFALFFIGAGGSLRQALLHIKNLLPAIGISLSSGCSLSTMPWTIEGAAKNSKNPDFAKAIIPATTNIQQIGDCLANAFLCVLIYFHFNGHAPPLALWLPFSAVFVLARFATAAVIGGAIFIMLPIYEHYLHFTPEMIAIILTFNVILDPIITCSNVAANGALCRIFERVWQRVAGLRGAFPAAP